MIYFNCQKLKFLLTVLTAIKTKTTQKKKLKQEIVPLTKSKGPTQAA